MLNTFIGILGTFAILGFIGCLWKWLDLKMKKNKNQIELIKYKKNCRIIIYFIIICFVIFLLVICLWFGLIYPTLK